MNPTNSVLTHQYKSNNHFTSDLILQDILRHNLSPEGFEFMLEKYQHFGKLSACLMDDLAMKADKNPPSLVKRNFYGDKIDEIEFHPAYEEMLKHSLNSNMLKVKWNNELREKYKTDRQQLGFASFFILALNDAGLHCPLCMTDGLASVIDKHVAEPTRSRILKAISSTNPDEFYSGAMFLTEKSGGSDVGRNLVKAEKNKDGHYHLNGEKWFCSNANADVILALARTGDIKEGIRGISLFLVEKNLPDGTPNPMNKIRLKDKLGVKSMASAEIIFIDTVGTLIGEEGKGFKIMAEMVNISRIHNAIASTAIGRRALKEAYEYTLNRVTFDKTLIEHPLVKRNLFELGALNVANMYFLWDCAKKMDESENGITESAEILRLLTPMLKRWSAQEGTYIVRESMELMGGLGYIEDGIMPKLMRDVLVTPIWEGSGNIQYLDMLRASTKSKGLDVIMHAIKNQTHAPSSHVADWIKKETELLTDFIKHLQAEKDLKKLEANAPKLFDRLTNLYQVHLLSNSKTSENKDWINPSIRFLMNRFENKLEMEEEISTELVKGLIGWEV